MSIALEREGSDQMKMVYTRLPDDDVAALDELADKYDIKRATLIRLVIVDALNKGIVLKDVPKAEPAPTPPPPVRGQRVRK